MKSLRVIRACQIFWRPSSILLPKFPFSPLPWIFPPWWELINLSSLHSSYHSETDKWNHQTTQFSDPFMSSVKYFAIKWNEFGKKIGFTLNFLGKTFPPVLCSYKVRKVLVLVKSWLTHLIRFDILAKFAPHQGGCPQWGLDIVVIVLLTPGSGLQISLRISGPRLAGLGPAPHWASVNTARMFVDFWVYWFKALRTELKTLMGELDTLDLKLDHIASLKIHLKIIFHKEYLLFASLFGSISILSISINVWYLF